MKRGPWRTSQAVWTPNAIELIFGNREVSHEGLYPSSRKALLYLPYVEIKKRWSMGQSWLANFLKKFSTFILKILFIYLTVPSLSWGMQVFYLCCGIQTLSFGMWDLFPWSGIEPAPSALGVKSLSHWTTREVPQLLCVCVCVCVCLQLCLTLCDPMDGR